MHKSFRCAVGSKLVISEQKSLLELQWVTLWRGLYACGGIGLSVHGFIEALLAIAKKRCTASEPLAESFQRLVSSCHAALEEERRRVASLPRLATRRRLAPTLNGRRSADVPTSPRQPPSMVPGRRQGPRSASSGALVSSGGSERADSIRRIDYKRFSPDVNGGTQPCQAFISDKDGRVKTEY